jgi:2-polyprenyl-3-methyl-5-hydroxy-6-metoxy-1,4-benzoquinol methylase
MDADGVTVGDDVARDARARWQALGRVNGPLTRPWRLTDADGARARVDPAGLLERHFGPKLAGKRVALACGGGGQQSAALGLLGAHVTVIDQDAGQLARDHTSWAAHGLPDGLLATVHADIRTVGSIDLPGAPFDLVWMPYSINFVPECRPVIAAIASQVASGGLFRLQAANPFVLGMHPDDRAGDAYVRRGRYVDGDRVEAADPEWVYDRSLGIDVPRAVEYRHTLATLVNATIAAGLCIVHLEDAIDVPMDPNEAPGTWDHFCATNPPWLAIWATRSLPASLS